MGLLVAGFSTLVAPVVGAADVPQTRPLNSPAVTVDADPVFAAGMNGHLDVAKTLRKSILWLGSAPVGQQVYAVFRKEFNLDPLPRAAGLHLFADSRYTLWVDGQYVDGNLWGALRPRGIPRLRETDVGPITLLEHARDNLRNYPRAQAVEEKPRPLAAALPLTLQAGDQLVFDAGEFAQAYSVLDCEADAGSEFELEYVQRYFETGRKPSGSYGRVNRYIARAGRQSYTSGDTFGFKYLVVRLKSGQAKLHAVRLVNRLYPFDVVGGLRCNDTLLTQLWSNCVQTIRVCCEDA